MRILLLTVDHNPHAPVLVRALARARPGDTLLAALSQRRERTGARRLLARYGARYVAAKAHESAVYRLRARRERNSGAGVEARALVSMDEVLAHHGIEAVRVARVNAPETLARLRAFAPDVAVSLYFDQILAGGALGVAAHGSVNLHPSLLPAHAGSSPVFWTLASGDAHAGITVHEIVEAVDAGCVLHQERVPVRDDDTVFSLYRRCTEAFLDPLLRWLDCARDGRAFEARVDPDLPPASYHDRITPEALRAFRARGRRFI